MEPTLKVKGFSIYQSFLDEPKQQGLVADLRALAKTAPFFSPVTPRGQPMSVRMTSAGRVGWVTDRGGYRYQPTHPKGTSWPEIPEVALEVWGAVSGVDRAPDSCLINFYDKDARMGMHQDKDEGTFEWPVVSISLGDEGLFRMGSTERGGKTESLWLKSGDVVVMAGTARLAHHGIDRIRFESSKLLPRGGRINLTMRVVASDLGFSGQ